MTSVGLRSWAISERFSSHQNCVHQLRNSHASVSFLECRHTLEALHRHGELTTHKKGISSPSR